MSVKATAADFVVSNNAVFVLFGDSYDEEIYGSRYGCYLHSYLVLNYPQYNIYWRSASRSGGSLDDVLTNRVEKLGLAHWGYQLNNNQHVGLVMATDNGGDSSNVCYSLMSQIFQAPQHMSDGGLTLTTQRGWASTHPIQWIGIGEIPGESSAVGSFANRDRNNAVTNAGWQLGVRGIDLWNALSPSWTNDWNTLGTNGLIGWFPTGGHPGNAGQLCMALVILRQFTTDTNISDCVVDWNGSVVSTNHCVVSGVTQSGNALTFQRLDDRLPMAYDVVDGQITNDCRNAFVLMPELAETFKFTVAVRNLPAGMYTVMIDGTPVATLPDTVLAAGWNMFTNAVGPYWAQRKEVLGRTRDQKHVNRVSLISGSAGDAQGLASYNSYASVYWTNSAYRGDTLISLLSNREANLVGYDAAIRQAAQPTNHTFTILPYAPYANIRASSLTNALNVPVILDGSSSIKATSYYWEQVSGLPQLDMIGHGTAKPMVISVTNAGTYTFRLTVSDGQTYSSNQVTLTFIQPTGRTIFVDNRLAANCLNNNYSIAGRNGAGSDAIAYTNIQSAANVARPGDLIYIRGGTVYTNAPTVANQNLVAVTTAGTATAPIRFEAYNNEHVTLAGWGFSDADTNADGLADGPPYPLLRQKLFLITTNSGYIQVKGLEMTNSQQDGLVADASFCYVQECVVHDNWTTGAAITRTKAANFTLTGTVFRWVESNHNRHFTGILMGLEDQSTFGFISDCAIVDCISDWNGYQADGHEVLPFGNDSQGGGNAGGFWTTKYFADDAIFYPQYGVRNWGTNLYFVRCISFNNCDDGFAFDHADSVVEDNRSLFNGPTGAMGYKMLRYVRNMTFRGNIAYGNMARGFELRVDTNSFINVFNNSSFKNAEYGVWISGFGPTAVINCTNNVAAFNSQTDWEFTTQPNNWSGDGLNVLPAYHGDPMLLNTNLTLVTAFQPGWTVRQKRDFLDNQIKKALSPAVGSPLLGSSTFVPGYHCPRPDNDPNFPMLINAPGRHWKLPAPDMGGLNFLSTSLSKPAAPTDLHILQ